VNAKGLIATMPKRKKRWSYVCEGNTIPTPVVMDDRILLMTKGLVCLRPSDSGKPEVLWESQKLASGACTPVAYQERVYNVASPGVLTCADAKTGKEIWKERLAKGGYWASPIVVEGE